MKRTQSKPLLTENSESIYISPNKLAKRWDCSRSSVDRVTGKAKFRRFILGSGPNGNIRYLLEDVEEFERKRIE
ncbi:MAG: hypothetical protein FPO08_16170 [Geobacter sp.]|nr:MAG: hypothetical protein FPO08_16170 [Geobacter sp.]